MAAESKSMAGVRKRRADVRSEQIHANRSAHPPSVPPANVPIVDAGTTSPVCSDAAAPVPSDLVDRLLERRPTRYERFAKPVLDRVAGMLLLLVSIPVLAVIALAVWMTLGSPVLIRQDRVGRDGRIFRMLKFRTMRLDRRRNQHWSYAGPERRMTHKSPFDPRHTPLGRKLRQNSLDELPQLFNVVGGDMSLVGPRPEMCSVAADYEDWQHLRHIVRPGLTGLWQITERANGTVMHEHTELDLEYVEQLSAWTDVSILWRTPRALLKKEQVH